MATDGQSEGLNMHDLAVQLSALAESPQEHCGRRVVTFVQMDAVHGRRAGTAKRNFWEHKEKLQDGVDFFRDEIRTANSGQGSRARDNILLTESGYLLLVKAFRDPLAWEVQRKLVDVYFRAKTFTGTLPDSAEIVSLVRSTQKEVCELRAEVRDVSIGIERRLTEISGDVKAVLVSQAGERRDHVEWTIRWWCACILKYFSGMCPKCGDRRIVDEQGERIVNRSDADHHKARGDNRPEAGWLICKDCHSRLGEPGQGNPARRDVELQFGFFQERLTRTPRPGDKAREQYEKEKKGQIKLFDKN